MKLMCLFFGHKPYRLHQNNGQALIWIDDCLGERLIEIDMCERCDHLFYKRVAEQKTDTNVTTAARVAKKIRCFKWRRDE